MKLPKVIASSVIRSSEQGDSHGGVYLINLEADTFDQVIDWNDPDISWEGRGWDRGLRGIAFYEGYTYIAASDELYVYNSEFNIVESFRNPYLKHCHEISIAGSELFLTSTGFDCVLVFHLKTRKYVRGYYLVHESQGLNIRLFDPNSESGPVSSMDCHLNNVFVVANKVYVSGTKMNALWEIVNNNVISAGTIPFGSHNARPYMDGVLLNDTSNDQVLYQSRIGKEFASFPVPQYQKNELTWTHLTEDRARQGFARGLCVTNDGLIVGGSSPSTVTVYKMGQKEPVASVQLSKDIRNSIHGLEIWPN